VDDLARLLANSLFDGAYRATGYILGPQQLKAFVRSFGEVSLDNILTHAGKSRIRCNLYRLHLCRDLWHNTG
jgi:hypothetical protein